MNHTHKTSMKDSSTLRLGRNIAGPALIGSVMTLAPFAAGAFVDERTPPPPPAPVVAPVLQPTAVPTLEPAVVPGLNAGPSAPAIPAAVAFEPGVMVDVMRPEWHTPYPGPYGQMPLADALIAQVVPVVGKAIELNGPPELLNKRVTLVKGADRITTLKNMANAERLGIFVQGELVTLASGNTPLPASAGAATFGGGHQVAEPLKITKTWHIEPGTMLSTAMLDWASQWDWKLIWQADVDYRIAARINVDGDFLDAVGEVLDAYKRADRPLWGDWNEDQRLLVIREATSRDR